MTRTIRPMRRLAAAVAAVSATATLFAIASPAAADPGDLSTTGGAQMSELADRYSSLSGALINFYAGQKGMTASQFMLSNPQAASALLGIPAAELNKLSAAPLQPNPSGAPSAPGSLHTEVMPTASTSTSPAAKDDLTQLQRQLSASGLSTNSGKYASLESYAQQLTSRSSSIDAAVVASGASWARQMGALRVPALSMPSAPNIDTSMATSMPKEGLMFGMFMDKSLTAMVADFPDVFRQVQTSGVGTAGAQQSWLNAMQRAQAGSQADFTSMMPAPCGASLLAGMSSGNAAQASKMTGNSCSPCTTVGLYMHSQMLRLFDPTAQTSLPNSKDNVISPSEWNRMQDWQRNAIIKQNPNLAQSLSNSINPGGSASAGCATGSQATSGALASTLPGVFANLQR